MKSFFPHLILLALIAFGSTVALGGNAGDRFNSPVSVGQGQSTSLKVLFDEGRGASNQAVSVASSGAVVTFTNDGSHLVSLPTITDTLATFGVTGGGTGDTSFTSNAVVVGNGTGALAVVSNNATGTNKFLTQSSSAAPAWSTIIGNDLPLATAATQGAVSITTQTFAGAKTFNGELVGAANTTATTLAATVPSADLSANTSNVNSLYFGSNSNNSFGVLASNATNDAYVGFGFYVDSAGSLRYSGTSHTSFMELLGGVILFKSDTGTPTQNSVVTPVSMLSLSTTAVTANQSLDAAGGFTADSAAYATGSVPGIVSTTTQTFAGGKTFNGSITRAGDDAVYVFGAAGTNTLSSATLSPVAFATTFVDQTSAFSSNTYTCKDAGIYRVAFDGSLNKTSGTSTAGDFWNINIRKNGTAINSSQLQMSMGYTTGQDIPFHTEVLVSLAVNDTITAAIVYNAGGARTWVGNADNVNLVITKI